MSCVDRARIETGLQIFHRVVIPYQPGNASKSTWRAPMKEVVDGKVESVVSELEDCLEGESESSAARRFLARRLLADGVWSEAASNLTDAALLYERSCAWGDALACPEARRLAAFREIEVPEIERYANSGGVFPFGPLFVVDESGEAWLDGHELGHVESLSDAKARDNALQRSLQEREVRSDWKQKALPDADSHGDKMALNVAASSSAPALEILETLATLERLDNCEFLVLNREMETPHYADFGSESFTLEADESDARVISLSDRDKQLDEDASWGDFANALGWDRETTVRLTEGEDESKGGDAER